MVNIIDRCSSNDSTQQGSLGSIHYLIDYTHLGKMCRQLNSRLCIKDNSLRISYI